MYHTLSKPNWNSQNNIVFPPELTRTLHKLSTRNVSALLRTARLLGSRWLPTQSLLLTPRSAIGFPIPPLRSWKHARFKPANISSHTQPSANFENWAVRLDAWSKLLVERNVLAAPPKDSVKIDPRTSYLYPLSVHNKRSINKGKRNY